MKEWKGARGWGYVEVPNSIPSAFALADTRVWPQQLVTAAAHDSSQLNTHECASRFAKWSAWTRTQFSSAVFLPWWDNCIAVHKNVYLLSFVFMFSAILFFPFLHLKMYNKLLILWLIHKFHHGHQGGHFSGIYRKVQLKPLNWVRVPKDNREGEEEYPVEALMVLKYGGVLTHAGRKQVEFTSPLSFCFLYFEIMVQHTQWILQPQVSFYIISGT